MKNPGGNQRKESSNLCLGMLLVLLGYCRNKRQHCQVSTVCQREPLRASKAQGKTLRSWSSLRAFDSLDNFLSCLCFIMTNILSCHFLDHSVSRKAPAVKAGLRSNSHIKCCDLESRSRARQGLRPLYTPRCFMRDRTQQLQLTGVGDQCL